MFVSVWATILKLEVPEEARGCTQNPGLAPSLNPGKIGVAGPGPLGSFLTHAPQRRSGLQRRLKVSILRFVPLWVYCRNIPIDQWP